MKIRVISLDFDGCIFNNTYLMDTHHTVITANLAFLNSLRDTNKLFDKTYIYIGSNRQSRSIDILNSKTHGTVSCFIAIKQIADHIESEFIDLLSADILNDLPEGTTYKQIIDSTYQGEHQATVFDEDKLTVIYAQIHHLANKHPDEEIIFEFYDDRGNEWLVPDILENLSSFFTDHPSMIPRNVTLQLNHYEGKSVTSILNISGTGNIDAIYRKTIIHMIEMLLPFPPQNVLKKATSTITPTLIELYKSRQKNALDTSLKKSKKLDALLTATQKVSIALNSEYDIFHHRPNCLNISKATIKTPIEQISEQLIDCISSCFEGFNYLRTFSFFSKTSEPELLAGEASQKKKMG